MLLHGGMGAGELFAPLLPGLTEGRRVILVDLQGHGRTVDTDRPLRVESMGMTSPPCSSTSAWPGRTR
ncbi:hypothetical protein U9R90_18340 [Streptomyces sp. E11-3]|uniref:alpha/beta fold hydrolase n=1 Tax=Streptomyces sp. E11-3 TaxID=3110112 RepID=UPI0039808367